jgi:hypothetical protein
MMPETTGNSMPGNELLGRWLASDECKFWLASHPAPEAGDWAALSEKLGIGDDALRTAMQKPHAVKPPFRSRRFELPVRWYLLGLIAVAAAGGFLAGASSSPIVATLLPLLFALIGGTGGVYLVTADLDVPGASWRLKWLGRSLASFGASFLLCAMIGAIVRIEYDRAGNKAEISSLGFTTVQDGLQLAALRAKLDILNSSAADQRAILNLAAQELKDQRSPIDAKRVRDLTEQAQKVLVALAAARKVSAPANTDVEEDLKALENSLESFTHSAVAWQDVGMPYDIYTVYHNSLYFRLSQFESQNKPDNLAWVQVSKLDRASLDVLLQNIHADFLKFDLLDWRLGKPMSNSLDDFLKIAIKWQKDKREEFLPSIDTSTSESESAKPSSEDSEKSDKTKAK